KGKYSDAYVFPSEKDIETKMPITSLDFASLYSSLIMTYNLSLEKFILSSKDADITQKNRNTLYEISFPFNKRDIYT
ncbi:15311_t:CDS:1, partial [Funneliformis geosporum]